jgi:hypothetical protein
MRNHKYRIEHGSASLLVMIIGVMSSFLLAGLIIFTAAQYATVNRGVTRQQALEIAEAGVNYYRWVLANNPDDVTNGTGQPGPYVIEYNDPGGEYEGTYELRIEANTGGLTVVTSTGWVNSAPTVKRSIRVLFGHPSWAEFAFLHNANVWFGQGMRVEGRVRTNGGIRQDGVNTSTLQTSKETYTCGTESGCYTPVEKPGIWGSGGPKDLWEFPITAIDFNSINLDFNNLKSVAQTEGVYYPHSGKQGYHMVLNADGTASVYEVETTDFIKGWSYDYGCQNLYQTILTKQLVGSHSIEDNPVFLFEDQLWINGTLNGKVTVVAARFPIDAYQTDIWIPDNLVYLDRSGDHKLGLIAQHDIIFAKYVPDKFEVNGALLSKNSRILRHHYNYSGCKHGDAWHRNELVIYGAVMSNLISYWNFDGGGADKPTSGFTKRTILYDPNMYFDPPPFFPRQNRVEIVSWEEVRNP